ncbi:Glucosamine-6-phosphate isomerase (Glucosamine-6-phosphate deaminase) (GNPDA) (GlcN6P deaminase) [Coemansia thaxteri]|nr:Glucosamine-6-phosphate isomerase (Glucosamine-6-phosphate deaminase) (GNPDA) (GlcN6P deaminase) [Coemansia thaxteri]
MPEYIKERINQFKPTDERPFVIGLPTGSSPIGVYRRLVRLYNSGELSFKNVVSFNMDEYVGLPRDHPESYHSFMWSHLFKHIDIPPENVNILNGNADDLQAECERYEAKILDSASSESSSDISVRWARMALPITDNTRGASMPPILGTLSASTDKVAEASVVDDKALSAHGDLVLRTASNLDRDDGVASGETTTVNVPADALKTDDVRPCTI